MTLSGCFSTLKIDFLSIIVLIVYQVMCNFVTVTAEYFYRLSRMLHEEALDNQISSANSDILNLVFPGL